MNKGLQVVESNANLAELIKDTDADEQILVLCTKPESIEQTINSYVLASAKIDSNTDMKDFSNQNWADVANAMNDLAHRNILMANLNEQSIASILSKLKSNNVKLKTVLTDDIEKLKTFADYAELELFLCYSGASITSFLK